MLSRGFAVFFAVALLFVCLSTTSFAAIAGYVTEPTYEPFTIDDPPIPLEQAPSLVTILDDQIPLAQSPNLVTILDDQIPLANLPTSGAYKAVGRMGVFGIASIGLGMVVILRGMKKKDKDSEN